MVLDLEKNPIKNVEKQKKFKEFANDKIIGAIKRIEAVEKTEKNSETTTPNSGMTPAAASEQPKSSTMAK